MKIPLFILLVLLGAAAVWAQAGDDPVKLNVRVVSLVGQGDLDSALPLADKLVEMQRRDASKPKNLVTALESSGRIRLMRFKRAPVEAKPDGSNAKDLAERSRNDAKQIETKFHEALELAKTAGSPVDQIVGMESDLAWLLYHYFPQPANSAVGFDRSARTSYDAQMKALRVKRLGEAKALYEDAVARTTGDDPANGDTHLSAVFNLAEYQTAIGELESAASAYRSCIETVTKKYGPRSQNLLPPLTAYLKLAAAADDADEVFETMSKIVRVTGKSVQPPNALLDLTARSAEGYSTSVSEELNTRSTAISAASDLQTRGAIANRGTGESTLTAVQGGSTFGKLYYDNSGSIRIYAIPVRVQVDVDGKVLEAEALSTDKDHAAEAEKIVKVWKFRPYSFNGKPAKLKGYVEVLFMSNLFKK